MSLTKSISSLPTTIIKKLTGSDKAAPLFIAPHVEDEDEFDDTVELACGHIFGKKDANNKEAKGAKFGLLSGSNSFLANLSIFEATRCPICESGSKDVGNGGDFDVAVKHVSSDVKGVLRSLEIEKAADEQSQGEVGK